MKRSILHLSGLLLLAAILLSACAGDPLAGGQSWLGVSADADKGVVYLSAGPLLHALDAKNGNLIWSAPEEANQRTVFFAPPLVLEDQVIVGDFRSSVHSFNSSDGSVRWVFDGARDRFIGGASAGNGLIFAPSSDYHIYALEYNGVLAYKFKTGQANWSAPVVDDNTVYVASMDHFLYAFNAQNGDLHWKTDMGGAMNGSPALVDGVLYVGTLNKEVLAVSAADGSIRWRSATNDHLWSTPNVINGMLFIGDSEGQVYAFSSEDGSLLWSASAGSPITARLAMLGDMIVAVTRGRDVVAFNFEGAKVWTRSVNDTSGTLQSDPVVVGDLLIIPVSQGADRMLSAFDTNGNEVWFFQPAD